MRYLLFITPLLMLLICGSACTSTVAPTPQITPVGTDINAKEMAKAKAQLDAVLKAKLEVAQYELKLYEEELKATKEEIRQAATGKGPSPSLLNWENELKGKVIQAKVKVRELEVSYQ
ncbi:MAG TPA: hypothetical protein VMG30_03885 [Acidobacteriota bacterium]|nr:hypothetical protein [Acidobacteriota bacterium]